MKTSWKPFGRSLLLIAQLQNGQQDFKKGGESIEDDGRSAPPPPPQDDIADENVMVVHTWICVIGGKTCKT